tara:strand:+ start:301 stop:594 length:294 start_codon:yes stop_codon:yes gene_type:complete
MSACLRRVWSVPNIGKIHKDINIINMIKNDSYEGPFVITEILPPVCPKCKSIIKNKCNISFTSIDSKSLDLISCDTLFVKCPIFGEVKCDIDDNLSK